MTVNNPTTNNQDSMSFVSGADLRKERKAYGLSQANLSRATGVTQAAISAFEMGKRPLTHEQISSISAVMAEVRAGRIPDGVRLRNWAEARGRQPRQTRPSRRRQQDPAAHVTHLNTTRGLMVREVEPPPVGRPLALSFFSGGGGMSIGFQEAGFQIGGFLDIDPDARETLAKNFPDAICLGADIHDVSLVDIERWRTHYGEIDVVCGGPPCQGFSLAGKRDAHDPRNRLVLKYLEIAKLLQPKAILIENVRLLTSMKNPEGGLVAEEIADQLHQIGYSVRWKPLNACDFGVPQWRERVFFIAYREDLPEPDGWFPMPSHVAGPVRQQGNLFSKPRWRTFRDATGDLASLESGERDEQDELHWAVEHPEHVLAMLRPVPEGYSAHENEDPALRPSSGYNTTYKRLRWDEPSSTIGTTFGMISACRTVHPQNTRSLTIREAMRCQTFPDNYSMFGKTTSLRRQIGNAVPPRLAAVLAETILNHLRLNGNDSIS